MSVKTIAWVLSLAILLWGTSAGAAESLASGDTLQAWQAAVRASEDIWQKMPFKVVKTVLTDGPAGGYGMYKPRASNVFKAEAKTVILIYLEPVGYKMVKSADGVYNYGVALDLMIANKDGKILFGQENFLKQDFKSWRFNQEIYLSVTLTLNQPGPGDYFVVLRAKDLKSNGQDEVRVPIVVQ
ncbi:MAG: hypothetical protein KQJ78_23820 [Deltaproteobacteria bacterium]|nr:hypothetical protein [Deltaproteobacteria bacterium]